MRIGMFHASLPQAGEKPGGVEKHVLRLSVRLAERGHDVALLSHGRTDEDIPGLDVHTLRPARWSSSTLARMTLVPLALNLNDTSELEVLHLHGDDWFYLRRRVPTVRTFYGSALAEARAATRRRRRLRQYVTTPLEALSARLATRSFGIASEDLPFYRLAGVLPCGVEVPPVVTERRRSVPTVLFVGTWEGRKRGRFLAELFKEKVRPSLPDAELLLVSDDGVSADGVEWLGVVTDDQLAALYQEAWVFCLPSTYEGFGIPYVEAMAHGTPVVATPNVGAQHLLRDGAGVLTPDEKLGEALVDLLQDAEARRRLSEQGRHRALEFSWPRVLDRHESVYREVIAQWRRR